jgi:hypothetical protein
MTQRPHTYATHHRSHTESPQLSHKLASFSIAAIRNDQRPWVLIAQSYNVTKRDIDRIKADLDK